MPSYSSAEPVVLKTRAATPEPESEWQPSPWAKREQAIVTPLLFAAAGFSILVTIGIVAILVGESSHFFTEVSLKDFFGDTRWTPLLEPRYFGVWPLISGTLLVAVGAGMISIPLGLGVAIFLSEYCPPAISRIVKPVLEVLAGIPTVVYGYFAVAAISPQLREFFPEAQVFNAASAAIVVGIMTLPIVASLCDDALRAVPRSVREAGMALGATKWEVAYQVVLPSAFSGIVAAFILALSRAIGETMAVTLAAGATPNLTLNPLESIQTMTAYIVQVSLGDAPHGTIEYYTLFAVGTVLFVITLTFNLLADWLVRRYRVTYE